jgi:hypothetical protein
VVPMTRENMYMSMITDLMFNHDASHVCQTNRQRSKERETWEGEFPRCRHGSLDNDLHCCYLDFGLLARQGDLATCLGQRCCVLNTGFS